MLNILYNLLIDGLLPEEFFVVAVGRRDKTTEQYISELKESIKEHSRNSYEQTKWDAISSRIHYYKLDFTNQEGYKQLDNYIKKLETRYKTKGNRLFYLAVSPEHFAIIVENLDKYGLADISTGQKKVIIEKPFGKNLNSAIALNKQISKVFTEDSIYRIDHYLGKETVQNLLALRFANVLFEPLWNRNFIDHVQITVAEQIGVGGRWKFYDEAGALRDMVQNHLLQLLCLVSMEPPAKNTPDFVRDEKLKVIRALEPIAPHHIVRGQYDAMKDRG